MKKEYNPHPPFAKAIDAEIEKGNDVFKRKGLNMESLERASPRLKELHDQENAMNLEMSYIDKQIAFLQKEKSKLQKRISGNMRYCNRLLNSTKKD